MLPAAIRRKMLFIAAGVTVLVFFLFALFQLVRLFGMAGGVLAAPRPPESSSLRYHVLLTIPESGDPFEDQLLRDFRAALAERKSQQEWDIAVQISERFPFMDSRQSVSRTVQMAMLAGLDGLIVMPPDPEFGTEIENVAGGGLPVVTVGRNAGRTASHVFVGPDDFEIGSMVGQTMAVLAGSPRSVGMLYSGKSLADANRSAVVQGLRSTLISSLGMDIAGIQPVESLYISATLAAEKLLRLHPDLDTVYCDTLPATLGMAQAVIDRNAVGKIRIVGTGMNARLEELLKERVVEASVVFDTREIAETSLDTMNELLHNGTRGSQTAVKVVPYLRPTSVSVRHAPATERTNG